MARVWDATVLPWPPMRPTPSDSLSDGRNSWRTLAAYRFVDPFDLRGDPDDRVRRANEVIPAGVKALDGRSVIASGFMMPLQSSGGKVSVFLLVRDRAACCFGKVLQPNEMMLVEMRSGRAAREMTERPIAVLGRLTVGMQREGDRYVGPYRMEADDIRLLE